MQKAKSLLNGERVEKNKEKLEKMGNSKHCSLGIKEKSDGEPIKIKSARNKRARVREFI